MAHQVDTIKLKKYKESRLKGNSKSKALMDIGVKPESANAHCSDMPVVLRGEMEIADEIDKAGLAKKAYRTLESNLSAERPSDRNTAASAILDFTEGKKQEVKTITDAHKDYIRNLLQGKISN